MVSTVACLGAILFPVRQCSDEAVPDYAWSKLRPQRRDHICSLCSFGSPAWWRIRRLSIARLGAARLRKRGVLFRADLRAWLIVVISGLQITSS